MSKKNWWKDWKEPTNKADLIYFTQHPPRFVLPKEELEKQPAHAIARPEDLKGNTLVRQLYELGIAFKNTNNPIYAFEAFVLSHDLDAFPPLWVMDFMSEVFNDWISLQGKKSLDELFELSSCQGQNKGMLYYQEKIDRRDEMLCMDVFCLNSFFSIGIENACIMAVRKLEERKGWNKTPFNIEKISADTIQDRYKKKWGEIFRGLHEGDHINFVDLKTKEERIAYLKQFPQDSFPIKTPLEKLIKKELSK